MRKKRECVYIDVKIKTLFDNLDDEEIGQIFRLALEYGITGIAPNDERWSLISQYVYLRKPPIRGASHWNWKGGITPKNQVERNSGKYAAWRNAVFRRDDYTCQMCGRRGTKLNAHHIIPWAKCEEERFNVSNGITLCQDCHTLVHSKGV